MPQPSPTRPRPARRSMVRALVLVLSTVALLGAAAPAQAIDRSQAAKRALAALGSREGTAPVIVFGLRNSLRAGSRITQTSAAKRSRVVLRVGGERGFFFYEDAGRSGRVALVAARSGQVTVSKTIWQVPLVNGRLPTFLTSVSRYLSPRYRIFQRTASAGTSAVSAAGATAIAEGLVRLGLSIPPLVSVQGNAHPKADQQDARVKKNRPKNIVLTGSDDGFQLFFVITQQPDHGTLSGQPPYLTYTPDTNYLGKDKFAFKANDGELDSNTAHVSIDVVPLGAPPVVTTSAGCTAYTERAPAVTVDGLIDVSDPDDTTLDSATVAISGNFVEGDDLLFTDQNGISGSYDDRIGVLTLTGTATVASYQAALRTVRYRNLSSGNPSPTKDVQFTANDAGSDSSPATRQICIGEGSGATRPLGEASEGALQYTENDGPVPVDPGFTAFDPDSTNLTGATIRFSSTQPGEEDELPPGDPGSSTFNYFPDEDALAFEAQNGITGSYDETNGVLTLTGTATVADYETAIRSVTYTNGSEDPREDQRTIRFQLTDSSATTSVPSTRGIFVTAVDDAPVVTTTAGSTPATGSGPSAAIDSELTVVDVDNSDIQSGQVRIASGFQAGDELNFANQSGISGSYDSDTGVLTLTGPAAVSDYEAALRTVEYSHPSSNPTGSRTVEFVVNDGELDSVPATKDVGVNDQPVLDTTDTVGSYAIGGGPVVVDRGITAADADSTMLSGATVQVTGNFSLSQDELAFTNQLGISGFYDTEIGVLSLTGTASIADYETALRSVTYNNTSASPSTETRTVSFRVDDGEASNNQSEPATRDVEITQPDAAPVVTTSAGSTTYPEGSPPTVVDGGVTVADADDTSIESAKVKITSGFESGDDLVYVDGSGISGGYDIGTGILTLTGTASVAEYQAALQAVKFDHAGGTPTGPKTVEFAVNDGELGSAPATKSVDIVPSF